METVNRTEKHVIKQSHPYYEMLKEFCHLSKNLYNHANYCIRQEFFTNKNWLRYRALDKRLKQDIEFPDYCKMPTAQSTQQVLKLIDQNWKSYFTAVKDWAKQKDKYLGKPKLPKYLKKDGHYCLILTSQEARFKTDVIQFPKTFQGFTVMPRFVSKSNFTRFKQARFIPRNRKIILELVYEIEVPEEQMYNGHVIGIDIGVDNLAAVANNFHAPAFVINGRPLKSMNQYANKEKAYYQSILMQTEGRHVSKRMQKLLEKREQKMSDYLHKASRYLINWCIKNNVTKIVIGQNKNWKQACPLGERANQNFVQIPFSRFLDMISYKAKEVGIAVTTTEESYTSGTSFVDGEEPVRGYYDKSRRIHRGLFVSNNGTPVNADINAAYQIIKKVVPIKWDRGCVLHPSVVHVA